MEINNESSNKNCLFVLLRLKIIDIVLIDGGTGKK